MTATTIRVQMAQRKDTAANWTAANPILLSGELAYETDTEKFKIGDGTTNWNSLAYLPIPDGSGNLTITGNLEIGTTGTLTFEGSTADGFETTLAVTDPTADRTITLPDVSGTVITTGDTGSVTSTMIADGTIVNADVSATAEIAVSKLANGTANQVLVTDGTDVSWSDDLTLAGNLTVNGTTTTVNTETLVVEDKNIELGVVTTPTDLTADGGGITLKGTTDKTINWIDATDSWTSSEHVDLASGKSYRINGTEVLSGTTLGSGVTGSSLTSVGTISSGTWQGTAIDAAYLDSTVVTTGDTGTVTSTMIADGTIVDGDINASAAIADTKLGTIATAGKVSNSATTATDANTASAIVARDASGNFSAGAITASLTGNASTATALATARTIGGVSFDGTANINLPGVNTAGNQDTSGNAATATKLSTARTFEVTGDITGTVSSDLTTGASIATSIAAGAIVDADINATAGIVDTKLATISTAGKVSNSATTATDANTASAIVARDASGNFAAGTITADLAGNAATVTTNANLTGDVTSVGNATSIAAGVIVDADVNASAAIAGTKIDPDFGSQTVETTGVFSAAAGAAATPSITFTGDLNTGIYSPGADQVAISSSGTQRVNFGTSEVVFNDGGENYDFRIESDTNANIFFVDASANAVGIGSNAPTAQLHVRDSANYNFTVAAGNSSTGMQIGNYEATDGYNPLTFRGSQYLFISTGGNERARIDSSGRLLVGTSTARTNFNNTTESPFLQIEGSATSTTALSITRNSTSAPSGSRIYLGRARGTVNGSTDVVLDGDRLGGIEFMGSDGTEFVAAARIIGEVDGTPGADDMPGRLVFSTTADGASSPTERMRITSGGNILVNTLSQKSTAYFNIQFSASSGSKGFESVATGNTVSTHFEFWNNSSNNVGSITTNNTATAYNTSSDYRLKENVAPVTDGITRLQQLKPSRFNFIADPNTIVDGFLAHEVQTIVPEAITGEKDAVDADGNPIYQGIDQSKLVPLLTAALQEAVAKIESLEARLTAAGI